VAAEPEKFFMPIPSEMRYQWIEVRLGAIDVNEMRELVTSAWAMCVPKRMAREYHVVSGLTPAPGNGTLG
jgi:hypothetical protein